MKLINKQIRKWKIIIIKQLEDDPAVRTEEQDTEVPPQPPI
jgi:hypothetical protein